LERLTCSRYNEEITLLNLSKKPNFRWCNNKDCRNGQIIDPVKESPAIRTPYTSLLPITFQKYRQRMPILVSDTIYNRIDDVTTIKNTPKEDTSPEVWKCSVCSHKNCIKCTKTVECDWHRKDRVVQATHEANQLKLRQLSKRCPARACGMRISYISKCKHMTCDPKMGGCGVKFCWECKIIFEVTTTGSGYKKYTYSHLATCPIRFGNLESGNIVPKPAAGNSKYLDGWDKDPDYIPPRST